MSLDYLHGIEVLEIDDGIRPIQTSRLSVIGIIGTAPDADASAFPLNKPVLVAGSRLEAAKLDISAGGTKLGTLPRALDGIFDHHGALVVVVRIEEVADTVAQLDLIVNGPAGVTDAHRGIATFLDAEALTGVSPRILISPGFSASNTVASELNVIAKKLGAVAIIDGTNTNDAAAIAYRGDRSSDRLYMVEPWVTVGADDTEEPPSPRVAGLIAHMDHEYGYWWSPSNQPIQGINGPSRPIAYAPGDPNSRANLLNEQNITTIIRRDGFRLHGNHTLSDDPMWRFLSVRRTADMVYQSVEEAMVWALDRPFSPQLLIDIRESVAQFLRSLQARGAIIGFDVWISPEFNTPAEMMAGKLTIDFDIEPPAPLERLTFRAHRNAGYYEELVAQVA